MTFQWPDFLAPLDPHVLVMAFLIGVSFGWSIRRAGHRTTWTHVYWQIASGVVFFVPLSLIRGMQGSDVWERFLATLVLWGVFVVGMRLGGR